MWEDKGESNWPAAVSRHRGCSFISLLAQCTDRLAFYERDCARQSENRKSDSIWFGSRPAARHLQRAGILVLHRLLRAQPAGGWDLPRLAALADRRRIHRPVQLGALLPGPAQQRQPQRHGGDDQEAHRWRVGGSTTVGAEVLLFCSSCCRIVQVAAWGCTTSAVRCSRNASATAPSLSRVPTATSGTAGTQPPSARSLQVGGRQLTDSEQLTDTLTQISSLTQTSSLIQRSPTDFEQFTNSITHKLRPAH